MHDPMRISFEIKNPFSTKKYPRSLITVWHKDLEKDGTDDSCGYFIRKRHLDQEKLSRIVRTIEGEHQFWYRPDGIALFSPIATARMMYSYAAYEFFDHNWVKVDKFMVKHFHDIVAFSENPTDSIFDRLNIGHKTDMASLAEIIACDVARKIRPWYKHPRWHIHHWQIKFDFARNIYRNYFMKCHHCGKRGWKGGWMGVYREGRLVTICGRHDTPAHTH